MRDEVEQAWTAKLRATTEAAAERQAAELREALTLADQQLSEKVTSVRAEGQRVLEAALEAARDEADRTLTARLDQQREDAERALEAARHEADRTLTARLDRLREDAERTLVEQLAAAAAAAPPPEPPPPPPPPIDDVVIRMRDGIRRLDRVSRLTEALDALGSLAAGEASRAAVLTVQDDRVRGWSFIGFEPAVDPAHQVDLTLDEAGLVGHAVVTGATQQQGRGPAFTALSSDGHAVAVPVLVGGEVMAVLYGDDGGNDPQAGWRQSLEILASHAGHCMEALTAARAAQLVGQDVSAMIVEERGPTLPFDDVPGVSPESEA